jgi:ABC-type multidrug transport system fused ATPase/permease subunit
VSFAYDGGPAVLDQVSFAVERGIRTAIVGPSGAGKSTTLALVERFYAPVSGAMRLDGVDVSTLPRAETAAQNCSSMATVCSGCSAAGE